MKNSRSIVIRRQQALLQLLKEQQRVDVEAAASALAVSPTTIRRDLMTFERQHLVKRYHGGATLISGTLHEEDAGSYAPSTDADETQKRAIASYAAGLIDEGDTIFINSSTTTLLLLDYIKDKHVIVVTNNTRVIDYPHDPLVTVILTGGELYSRRPSLIGSFALQTLSKINADKAFIGVGGISVAAGITTSVLPETEINATMMRRAPGAAYVLTANKKIGREHNFLSAPITSVDSLITGVGGDASEIANLRAAGVDVVELEFADA